MPSTSPAASALGATHLVNDRTSDWTTAVARTLRAGEDVGKIALTIA